MVIVDPKMLSRAEILSVVVNVGFGFSTRHVPNDVSHGILFDCCCCGCSLLAGMRDERPFEHFMVAQ